MDFRQNLSSLVTMATNHINAINVIINHHINGILKSMQSSNMKGLSSLVSSVITSFQHKQTFKSILKKNMRELNISVSSVIIRQLKQVIFKCIFVPNIKVLDIHVSNVITRQLKQDIFKDIFCQDIKNKGIRNCKFYSFRIKRAEPTTHPQLFFCLKFYSGAMALILLNLKI